MHLVTEAWDDQLVVDLFSEEDAKDIIAIPIREGMEDHIAWHFDPKGRFSVKSAYHLGVRLRDVRLSHDTESSLVAGRRADIWSCYWNLSMPDKVRIFTRRLAQNSLPLRIYIKRKKVDLDTICQMCGRLDVGLQTSRVRASWSWLSSTHIKIRASLN